MLARTLGSVGAALALISAVILLVQFVALSRSIGVRADVSAGDLFGLTLLESPGVIQVTLPIVFLFGTGGAFVGLNRRSELVAMRAAGISAWRFISPAAAAALIAGILVVVVLFWLLTDVREASAGESSVRSDSLSIRSTLDSEAAVERFVSPEAIASWRLPQAIRSTEAAGFSASGYRLRLQQLLATPLLFAAMAILAAAFSLRLARLGGLAPLAGAGVALGFVVYFFNSFSGALGRADIIPLFAAAWAPAVVALLAGLTLLCYTEDG